MRSHQLILNAIPRGALLLAGALLTLALVSVIPILADRDEVIVSIEVLNSSGGSEGGGVRLSSESGGTIFLLSGQRTTIAEGEFVTLEALPDRGYIFQRWEGQIRSRVTTVATPLYGDTTIRMVVIARDEDAPDDADVGDRDEDGRGLGGGSSYEVSSTIEEIDRTDSFGTRASRSHSAIWVDFTHVGIEDGTSTNPYDTLAEGVSAGVALGGPLDPTTINIQSGVSLETITINPANPITLTAPNGTARIGVASFTASFTLATSKSGSGSVSGAGGYASGSVASVSASPSANWEFSHWLGDLAGATNPESLIMDGNKSVTAVFVENPANLTITGANIDNGGNDPLPASVKAGDAIDVEWFVTNNGDAADSADDDWTDNVFLSRDAMLGEGDKALAAGTIIAEQESYTGTATITIPDASPGDYFLLFRTDTGEEVTHTQSDRQSGIFTHAITIHDSELM